MKQMITTALIGSLVVVLFDTFASFISRSFQINYSLFSFGSFFIYACVGFFAAKHGNLFLAVLASAVVGLIESTLGWYISWIVGPGRPEVEMNSVEILTVVIFVVVTSSVFGLIGALVSKWI